VWTQIQHFFPCSLFRKDRKASGWRDTQRYDFEPPVRAFAAEGYLMSAFSNRKLKTSKASPACPVKLSFRLFSGKD